MERELVLCHRKEVRKEIPKTSYDQMVVCWLCCSKTYFMCAYHKAFIVPHFEWLQKMDERTKRAGFRSRSILERYYLMHSDLTHLKANWERDPCFRSFIEVVNDLNPEDQKRLYLGAEMFFGISLQTLTKHFN
mmetsp:Transcript_22648/g.67014  ORF Transcript_22648/g.67014 Transcript_22648/m.67014 type:complete len:133 (+) Transcript_22648:1524-1922(+)